MVWILLGAGALGIGIWWLAPPAPPREARPPKGRRPPSQTAWVTAQALRFIGWSAPQARTYQAAAAGGVTIVWWLLTKSLPAAIIMAYLGWQLPVFWAELRAGHLLSRQLRQVSVFVGTLSDSLNTGNSIHLAVDAAARQIDEPPLQAEADVLVRRINSGTQLVPALRQMSDQIQWSWWNLFVDLVELVQNTGGDGSTFNALSWQLQEQDRIQSEFRTLVTVYLLIVVIFLGLTVGGQVGTAFVNPAGWLDLRQRLGWILIVAAIIAVFCFGGVRKYARMMIQLED